MKRQLLFLGLMSVSGCRIEPQSDAHVDTVVVVRAPVDTIEVVPVVPAGRPVVAPSGLAVPVAGIRPANLVDTFDDARSEGRIHDAIDIPAPRGTPVVAAAPGTLARVLESEKGGHTVYVVGEDGRTVYYYAHLDAYAPGLEAGQAIVQGQVLGTVGSTGNASPEAPHLHFAIWIAPDAEAFWDGESLNPYPLLTGR